MTKEEMQALSDLFDQKLVNNLKPINDRLEKIEKNQANLEKRFDNLEENQANLEKRFDNLEKRFDNLEENQVNMDKRLDNLEKGQTEIKQRLVKIEIKIENEIERNIQKVAEGHSIINRKLDKIIDLESRLETVEHKVAAIEYAMGKSE